MLKAYLVFLLIFFASACTNLTNTKPTNNNSTKFTQINSMLEIAPYVLDADLIIFDIDHTILESKTVYCHSNWFYDQYEDAINLGHNSEHIVNKLIGPWEESQSDCLVKPVENFIPDLIKTLQKSGKKVMALTSRSQRVADISIAQLSSLGVDFSQSAPAQQDFVWDMSHKIASKHGVVFSTDYVSKGEVLKEYLKLVNYQPKNILFIDDSKNNLISVKQVLSSDNLQVNALFYPLVKRTAPHWDKKLAQLEWEKRHGKISF